MWGFVIGAIILVMIYFVLLIWMTRGAINDPEPPKQWEYSRGKWIQNWQDKEDEK